MAKKVILIILGVLLGLCGIASICFGGIFLGVGGTSGTFKSDYHTISTPTVGFVSDPAKVENSQDTQVSGTSVTLKIDGRNSTKPLFYGVGPTDQVNAYLSGAPYQQVSGIDFSPFKITSSTVDGTTKPAAPGDQAFWVAKASGTDPALSWKILSGDYEAVLMNADGSPGFQAETRLGIDAPILGKLGIGGLIVGVIVALGGLALLIWGIRTKRPLSATANPYPASYAPPTGYPPNSGYAPPAGYQPPTGYQPPPAGYEPPPGYGQPGGYEPPPGYGQPGGYPPPSSPYPPVSAPPAATPPVSTPPAMPPVPPPVPEDPYGRPDSPPQQPPPVSGWEPPDDPTAPPKP